MSAEDIVIRDDIPVTSPARTLVDQGTQLAPVALERAVNDADKRDLIDPETLREDLERFAGEPGHPPPSPITRSDTNRDALSER
jgi:hypothetical protein